MLAKKIESINTKRDQFKTLKEDFTSKKSSVSKKTAGFHKVIDDASEDLNSACVRALSAAEMSLDKIVSELNDRLTVKGQQCVHLSSSLWRLEVRGAGLRGAKVGERSFLTDIS
ncbi:unnamed protein product [Dibothriocephalus latus]|uniref:Uncharacterized protein n=1 Tax=Dibothriocephalus latus TaxID=60516 RepID=A0A3P7P6Z3_DIBLA|nr:unnamed protein product [Dibothriocephalus latus]